jgi:transposase
MVLQVIKKAYKLNICSLTKTKTRKLKDLEDRYRAVLNIIKTGVEFWDAIPGSDDLPFKRFNLQKLLYKGVSTDSNLQSQQIIDAISDAWANRKDPCARFKHPTIPYNPVFAIAIDDSGSKRMAIPIAMDGAWVRFRKELDKGWTFTYFELHHRRSKGEDRWCIIVTLRKEFQVKDLDRSKTVLGIDIGCGTLAAGSVLNKKGKVLRQRYFGRDLAHRQRNIGLRRSKLFSYADKGSRKARKKLKSLKGYETNLVKTRCYQVAHEVVDWALKFDSMIAIEDLKGLHKRRRRTKAKDGKRTGKPRFVEKLINRKVHHMPNDIFSTALTSVSYQNCIGTGKVNPAYTSQTCSRCHAVDREYRKGCIFHCGKCGLLMNADRNASVDIGRALLSERSLVDTVGQFSGRDDRVNGHDWGHDGGKDTGRGPTQPSEPKLGNLFPSG